MFKVTAWNSEKYVNKKTRLFKKHGFKMKMFVLLYNFIFDYIKVDVYEKTD